MRIFFLSLMALFLLPATALARDALDYPYFRHTKPVVIEASRIVIQNDEKPRRVGRDRWARLNHDPDDTVERYLRARLRPSGSGPLVHITIRRGAILDQGNTGLGSKNYFVDIALDVTALSSAPARAQRRTEVVAQRSVVTDERFYGSLPVDRSTDFMEDVIKTLDRRMMEALAYELKVLAVNQAKSY